MNADPADRQPARNRAVACAVVVLALLVPAVSLMLTGVRRTASYADEVEYHLPTIRQFAADWPAFDFATATAAMTPGYHLLMAALLKLGGSELLLRVATLGITAGFVGTLAWAVAARVPARDAILLCLPVAWSQYVLIPGIYVVPHNLGWWGVLLIVLVSTRRRWTTGAATAGGVLLAGTVFVRQIHIWTAAGLIAAAATAAETGVDRLASRTKRVLIALACCVPAVAVLGVFYRIWGGLAPKTQTWSHRADGINVAAVVMIFATFGLLGPLLIARLPAGRRQWLSVLTGAVIGVAVAVVGSTTYDAAAGRWSGLWNLAGALGTVGQRSVLIVLLAMVGAACVGLLLASIDRHRRCVWLALLAGFFASNAVVNQAWQRYYEPMVLIVCVLMLSGETTVSPRQRWGRAALAVVQAALLAYSLRGA